MKSAFHCKKHMAIEITSGKSAISLATITFCGNGPRVYQGIYE